jgi:preprotein translocase subunit Sec61beta
MAKDKKGEGFHSAAGLIRYFDAEDDKALKVNPYLVAVLCIVLVAIVEILKWRYIF